MRTNASSDYTYDPATDTWTSLPNPYHYSTQLFLLGDGSVVLLAGQYSEIFDPVSNTWSSFSVPNAYGDKATVLPDGRLFLVLDSIVQSYQYQGSTYQTWVPSTAVAIYDPQTKQWTNAAPIPWNLTYGGLALLQRDGTVLVGGSAKYQWSYNDFCQCNDLYVASVDDGWTGTYDPLTDTWSDGPVSQLADGTIFDWDNTSVFAETLSGRVFWLDRDPFSSTGYPVERSALLRVLTPPVAVALDQSLPGFQGLTVEYTLDASGSYDADGDPLVTFTWSEGGTVLATSATPQTPVPLDIATHHLTLTVTNATGQTGTKPVTVVVYDGVASAVTAATQTLNGTISDLQSQLATTTASLNSANAQIAVLTLQVSALTGQLKSLQTMLAAAFGSPTFTLPGATPQAQLQNLVNAIGQLNHGQQQALYKNLGGK